MANARTIGISVISIIAALIVVGGGGYYVYQQQNYVSTDNASIQGTLVPLTAPADGTLIDWRPTVGAVVSQGTLLGKVEGLTSTSGVPAPVTGTIVQNDAVDRETVVPGQPIAYLMNLNNLHIVANVDESSISHVAVGKTVDITVDAYPRTPFTGTVTQIGSATAVVAGGLPNTSVSGNFEKTVQRVPVYIAIGGDEGKTLMPGMSVEVSIHRN